MIDILSVLLPQDFILSLLPWLLFTYLGYICLSCFHSTHRPALLYLLQAKIWRVDCQNSHSKKQENTHLIVLFNGYSDIVFYKDDKKSPVLEKVGINRHCTFFLISCPLSVFLLTAKIASTSNLRNNFSLMNYMCPWMRTK